MINPRTETSSDLAGRQFVLTRVFDAPRALVWKMWTEPEHMAKWFGPRIFTNPICELDVRPGGQFRVVMESPAGEHFPFTGVYLEVEAPSRLVYKNDGRELGDEWKKKFNPDWDGVSPIPEPIAEITFEDVGGKTRQAFRVTFASKAILEGHAGMYEGWSDSLDAFAELVVAGRGDLLVQVTRMYTVPAELVYDAWLNRDAIGGWLFKTPDGDMIRVELDARVGAGFQIFERRGELVAEHYGAYLELERPRRIVFDFAVNVAMKDSARVEIEITPRDGGCELRLTQTLPRAFAEYADRSREGWVKILAKLARQLGMSGGIFPGDKA